ncbi:hypothetical protein IW150_001852 [Coemansia sp. RSA 2607]|nr:hypothetical protein IW150_001852 [Coemansia sp. RSA 2607]
MRYHSPPTQLLLVVVTLLLTTSVRRLVYNYLLQVPPVNENLSYDGYLSTGIIACCCGFLGIFLVNLSGIRFIFVCYTLTNILCAASVVSYYLQGPSAFQFVAMLINSIGYDIGRVATLVVVLAYPGEKWKARALAAYLLVEYFSITMGDVIAMVNPGSTHQRYHLSIAYLCLALLAPIPALAIAPSDQVVRDNGVYLVTPKTTLLTELRQTAKMFTNKYMLLLVPYMFSYPFLFGSAEVEFPNIKAIVLYDAGKLFIVFMSQMLDVRWTGRRTRGLVGLALLIVFFAASIGSTAALRLIKYDLSGIDMTWSHDKIAKFVMGKVFNEQYVLLMTSYFLAGAASSFIELYGYWVMGTLTNDLKSSGRFVGTYHSTMAIGGLIGYQTTNRTEHGAYTSNIPMFIAIPLTCCSLVCMYFIVRRITETNDWTLGRMNYRGYGSQIEPERSSETIVITDVKYVHTTDSTHSRATTR